MERHSIPIEFFGNGLTLLGFHTPVLAPTSPAKSSLGNLLWIEAYFQRVNIMRTEAIFMCPPCAQYKSLQGENLKENK
jgi:hypothetical protein